MTTSEFFLPASDAALTDEAAQVWLARLDVAPERLVELRAVLTAEERARADRFLQPLHRAHHAAGRGILRELLGRALGVAPAAVEFSFNAHGKPSLAGALIESGLRFNLSHSHGFALVALARGREVGVDIERIRPGISMLKIAERFFAPAEVARLRALPAEEQARAFFECWTRKEAYVKARGEGLMRALGSFEVTFGPDVAPALQRADDEASAAGRWVIDDLPVPEGFAGALVIEGPPCAVGCWRVK